MDLRSCSGFVTSSPTMVWMTPILPLSKPPATRASKASQMLDAKPTMTMDSMVPRQPSRRTGLRPILSDRPPQYMPIRASDREKDEMRRPA